MHLVKEAQNRYIGQISAPEIFLGARKKFGKKKHGSQSQTSQNKIDKRCWVRAWRIFWVVSINKSVWMSYCVKALSLWNLKPSCICKCHIWDAFKTQIVTNVTLWALSAHKPATYFGTKCHFGLNLFVHMMWLWTHTHTPPNLNASLNISKLTPRI